MENQVTLVQKTVVLTAEGRREEQETVAIEVPYKVALNDREIGASMVLETGLEEFGAGFLFGQGTRSGSGGACLSGGANIRVCRCR